VEHLLGNTNGYSDDDLHIFDRSQTEIYRLMASDSFPRFQKTVAYSQAKELLTRLIPSNHSNPSNGSQKDTISGGGRSKELKSHSENEQLLDHDSAPPSPRKLIREDEGSFLGSSGHVIEMSTPSRISRSPTHALESPKGIKPGALSLDSLENSGRQSPFSQDHATDSLIKTPDDPPSPL